MKIKSVILYLVILLITLLQCSRDNQPLAGDVIENPNEEAVWGKLVTTGNVAAPNEEVVIREVKIVESGDSIIFERKVVSDSTGKFVIDSVQNGTYVLVAGSKTKRKISSHIKKDTDSLELGTVLLENAVVVNGRVINEPNIFVSIPGSDLKTKTDENGYYTLQSVPPGACELVFVKGSSINYLPITVKSNTDTVYVRDVKFALNNFEAFSEMSIYKSELISYSILPFQYSVDNTPDWYTGKSFESVDYFAIDSTGVSKKVGKEWFFSQKLILNTSATGSAISLNLNYLPVLVELNKSNFEFNQANKNGSDVRFYNSQDSLLVSEIEYWNFEQQEAFMWIRVPLIIANNSTQFITMLWGNAGVTFQDDNNVFRLVQNKYVGVWHMDSSLTDVTDSAWEGESFNTEVVEGKFGLARKFTQSNKSHIKVNTTRFNFKHNFTAALWAKIKDVEAPYGVLIAKGKDAFAVTVDAKTGKVSLTSGSGPKKFQLISKSSVLDNKYHYISVTKSKDSVFLNIDNVLENSVAFSDTFSVNTGPLTIGGNVDGNYVDAIIDEVRLNTSERPQHWVKACYANQKENQTLVEFVE